MRTAAPVDIVPKTPFFSSWSGGKDCCLALELSADDGAGLATVFLMSRPVATDDFQTVET